MNQTPELPSNPPRWATRRKLLTAGLVVLVFILILVVAAMFYIRSGRLNRYIASQVQTALQDYGLRADIGGFDLVWGIRTARAHDIKIYNQETGQLIATLDNAELVVEIPNPFALRLRREVIFKRLDITNLQVYADIDANGRTNFNGLHQPPPSAPSRITFDLSKLVGSLNGGMVHVNDQTHKIAGELGDLKANAQPLPDGTGITVQFNTGAGRVNYEGRETSVDNLELAGRLLSASAEIDRFIIHAPLGEINVGGKLDDLTAPRYDFNVQAKVALADVERVLAPELGLQGTASFDGHIGGEGNQFQITGGLTADELEASGDQVRGAKVNDIHVQSDGERITFSSPQAHADAVFAQGARLTDVTANRLSGEVAGGNTKASVQQVSVGHTTLSSGKIAGITVHDITANVQNGRTQANVRQVTASSAEFSGNQLSGLAIQGVTANIEGSRTQARAQQATVTRVTVSQGQINNILLQGIAASLQGSRYQVTGNLTVGGGVISDAPLGPARGQLVADNNSVALNKFTASLLGGGATGDAVIALVRGGASRLTATLTDLKTGDIANVAKVKDAPLAGTLNGQVNVTWPGTSFDAVSGTVTAHLSGQTTQTANAIPVTGDVAVRAQSGVFNVDQLTLDTGASHLTATGRLSQKDDSDLNFSLTSTRAEELQTIAYSIPDVEKSLADYKPRLEGNFSFQGRVTGKLSDPAIEGDVNAASIGVRDEPLGSLTGHVLFSPTEVAFQNGNLAVAKGGTVQFSYAAPRASTATSGRLDATINGVNVETITAAAGLSDQSKVITGELSGEAHLTGLPDSPTGTATINLGNGTVVGQAAQVATANVIFDGKTARLERGEVRLSQGQLVATGTYDLKSNNFQAQGSATNVDLDQLATSLNLTTTTITGTAGANFQASGNTKDIGDLQVELTAQGQKVAINGRDAGQLSLTAHTNPGGRIDVELVTGIAGKPQPLRASIELRRPGRPITVDANLTDFDLGPVIAAFAPDAASSVAGIVNGRLHVAGPIENDRGEMTLDALRGDLTLNTISLQVQGRQVNIQTPLTVALNGPQVSLTQTSITGEGFDLKLGGTVGLNEGSKLAFALTGTANLDRIGQVSPDIFLGGTVAIDARLGGTVGDPQLAGQITMNNLSFEGTDLPVNIQEGNGRIVLAGDRLTLENFTAKSNDGTLDASGTLTLAQLKPKDWNFKLNASNMDVLYEGAQVNLNANLTLTGTPDRQVLSGTVTIPEGEYTTDINLQSFASGGGSGSLNLGEFGTGGGGSGFLGLPPLNLDLHIEAPDSLLIRNKQINTVASAALTVGGTINDPSITGRVAIEGGTIKLRSQSYDITTGTLDFLGGGSTPIINVQTEADISGYHVYVGLEGPIDQIEPTLRSDPDLPRSDILSLVATGHINSNSLGSQDLVTSGLGAAASLLSETFISQPAQSLLGLNRFSIDPVLSPNANPAARLTIGRQLTRDLSFTYSTNVGSEQDQSVIVEYILSNRFSGVASYTQGGAVTNGASTDSNFTIEVRGRRRFALGYGEPASATGTTPKRPARPAKPALPHADVTFGTPAGFKLSSKKVRELVPAETQGFSRALARLGERNLSNYLQEQGYFFATVKSHCEPADCSGPNVRLVYDVQPGDRLDLDQIRIEGTDLISVNDVSDQLQSKKASFFGSVPFLKNLPLIGGLARGITSDDRIRQDRNTIRARMGDLGFRSARVTSRIDRQPQSPDMVLVFKVDPGVRSTVSGVTFRGNSVLPSAELRKGIPMKDGAPFSPTNVRDGIKNIKAYYADQGFLDTKVQYTIVDLAPDQIGLVYSVDEGARSVVAEIAITGETKTRENSIRRFFAFKPGDVLTPALIRRTQRDLYATGAFSEVYVHHDPAAGSDPDAQKVTVHVTEAKPLLFTYGIGYSTDEGPRGTIQLTDSNIFKRVDSASIRLRGSMREQLVQLSFTDLRPFGSPWATTVSVFYDRNSNLRTFVQRRLVSGGLSSNTGPGFGISRFASFIQAERKFSDRDSLRLRYSYQNTNLFNVQNIPLEEIARNEQAIRLGTLSAGFTHDTRDSALNPTNGQLISFEHTLAARPFGGNVAFNKLFTNYQYYKTLARSTPVLSDTTLVFAARIGLAAPYSIRGSGPNGEILDVDRQLPISERFFSGGATTLRGFRYDEAGPQGILEPRNAQELPTLVPVGGDALVVLNFELRYPLTRQLRLVPFYDLGNVFRRVSDISLSGLTHSVGLGLRLNTPIGPVGIDYGYLLNPPSFTSASGMILRQPQGVIHIRFGQTF